MTAVSTRGQKSRFHLWRWGKPESRQAKVIRKHPELASMFKANRRPKTFKVLINRLIRHDFGNTFEVVKNLITAINWRLTNVGQKPMPERLLPLYQAAERARDRIISIMDNPNNSKKPSDQDYQAIIDLANFIQANEEYMGQLGEDALKTLNQIREKCQETKLRFDSLPSRNKRARITMHSTELEQKLQAINDCSTFEDTKVKIINRLDQDLSFHPILINIVTNLINNCRKAASNANNGDNSLTIIMDTNGLNRPAITFYDSAEPLKETIRKGIFNSGAAQVESNKENPEDHGIGLATCKGLADRLGWILSYSDLPKKNFSLSI